MSVNATQWTRDKKLAALMKLSWTVTVTKEDDGSFFARVEEIPDAVADGETEKELALQIWESLQSSLALRLDQGDDIALPSGRVLPWLDPDWKEERPLVRLDVRGDAWRQPVAVSGAASEVFAA